MTQAGLHAGHRLTWSVFGGTGSPTSWCIIACLDGNRTRYNEEDRQQSRGSRKLVQGMVIIKRRAMSAGRVDKHVIYNTVQYSTTIQYN